MSISVRVEAAAPNYDRCTVTAIAGTTVTIGAGLAHAHHRDDVVTKLDAHGGNVKLTAAAANAATIQVTDGTHFSVNDGVAIGTGSNVVSSDPNYDHGTVTAIAGNTLTISPVLTRAHHSNVVARTVAVGNNSALTAAVAVGATTLAVGAGSSFAVNDMVALGASANPTLGDGRLISNSTQRAWIRTNIHDRHMAPAGAVAGAGGGGGPGPEGAPGAGGGGATGGVEPGGGGTGRKAHRSGP